MSLPFATNYSEYAQDRVAAPNLIEEFVSADQKAIGDGLGYLVIEM